MLNRAAKTIRAWNGFALCAAMYPNHYAIAIAIAIINALAAISAAMLHSFWL